MNCHLIYEKTETQLRDAEDELRKAKRESEDSKLLYDEVNSTLAKTQATLEKTIFEAKQKTRSFATTIISCSK